MEDYAPPEFVETREPAFWPTCMWVVGVHFVVLLGVIWAGSLYFKPKPQEGITWLDGGGIVGNAAAGGAPAEAPAPPAPAAEPEPPTPEPEPVIPPTPPAPVPPPAVPDEIAEAKATPPPVKPVATPKPTPKPTPTPKPKVEKPKPEKPKETPKPTAKNAEKKTPAPSAKLATPKPAAPKDPKATAGTNGEKSNANRDVAAGKTNAPTGTKPGPGSAEHAGTKGGPGAKGGTASGALSAAQLGTYFNSVGAKFNEVWNQPLTTEGNGQDLVATVHIRVSADGTVLSAVMEKGTGNREVDASIEAAIPKFKKVPPPPPALLKDGVMDEKMAAVYDL